MLAVLCPALAAGALVAVFARPPVDAGGEGSPAELAGAAGQPARSPGERPLVLSSAGPDTRQRRPVAANRRPAPPARLSIPGAGVDAPIQPVGTTAQGIDVPPLDRAGWFDAGARPGEPGRSVIIGHRDGPAAGAVFENVREIGPGDPVEVTDREGSAHRYRVVGSTDVDRDRFPAQAVYGRSKRSVLVLVTCGGDWSARSGYEDNVLVFARAA